MPVRSMTTRNLVIFKSQALQAAEMSRCTTMKEAVTSLDQAAACMTTAAAVIYPYKSTAPVLADTTTVMATISAELLMENLYRSTTMESLHISITSSELATYNP